MVKEIVINSWNEIHDLEVQWPMDIYRGQSNVDWPLSSSLQRYLSESGYNDSQENTEYWLLREFKKGARRYLEDIPPENDIIQWISLMQHYGAPTRLIDFSYSFYVACYFALIDANKDSAVWAIDSKWLLKIGHSIFNLEMKNKLRDEWEDKLYDKSNELLNTILSSAYKALDVVAPDGITSVEPFYLHNRLGTQQGLFILPFNIHKSVIESVTEFSDLAYHEPIKKIILKEEVRSDGLAHLKQMNITSETLFPGMDGFARSITHKAMYF